MSLNIDNLWNSVKKSAGSAKTIAELKIRLTKEKNALSELYRSLGVICYEKLTSSEGSDGEFCREDEIVLLHESISEKLSEIEGIRKELCRAEGNIECHGCGKSVSLDYQFCPFCGEKLPEQPRGEAEDIKGEPCGEQSDEAHTEAESSEDCGAISDETDENSSEK